MSPPEDPIQEGPTGEAHEPPELDRDGELFRLLDVPDRDRCPGARVVVPVSEGDDQSFIAEVNAHCVSAPELQRRGHFHGHLAELDDSLTFVAREPMDVLAQRFQDAKPIVLHDALSDEVLDAAESPLSTANEHPILRQPSGLETFLAAREHLLGPEYRLQTPVFSADFKPPLKGPKRRAATGAAWQVDERDLAKGFLSWKAPKGRPVAGPASVNNLWVKSQRLSLHPGDASVRLRFSFGDEVQDDASRDTARHRLVHELAARLMPEAAAIRADPELRGLLTEWLGEKPLLTQDIAYWNAPNGGALFHHDAFDEPTKGGQRGVLYSQITGSTLWLALSITDLALRVEEFVDFMEDGTLPAAHRALITEHPEGPTVLALMGARTDLLEELAKPGCGILGPLVNYGPDFTSLLAAAGHAYVLGPGDLIVLPNHGYAATCMHSVFCVGDDPGFALSMAVRTHSSHDPSSPRGKRSRRARPGRRRGRRRAR